MRRGNPKLGARRLGVYIAGNLTNELNRRLDEGLQLSRAWMAAVPEPLASHAHPVRYTAGLLFIRVDTSAWASRLRHQQPVLIASLKRQSLFRDLVDIRTKVVPREEGDVPPPPRRVTRLSAKAAHVIDQAASTITHPGLREALERLAHRGPSLKKT